MVPNEVKNQKSGANTGMPSTKALNIVPTEANVVLSTRQNG
jgi:hypothetical protein